MVKILGYKNFSEYALTMLCAKSPENVDNFLNKLAEKMRILQKKEMDILLNYKKEKVKLFFPVEFKQANGLISLTLSVKS